MTLLILLPAVEMRSPEHPGDDFKSGFVTVSRMLRPEVATQCLETPAKVGNKVDIFRLKLVLSESFKILKGNLHAGGQLRLDGLRHQEVGAAAQWPEQGGHLLGIELLAGLELVPDHVQPLLVPEHVDQIHQPAKAVLTKVTGGVW